MARFSTSVLQLLLVIAANSIQSQKLLGDISSKPSDAIKTPVIIDTDIGSYIDDMFAIIFATQSENLDVKLIVTCTDDTTARARIAARLLNIIGRNDIPIGIGFKNDNKTYHALFGWAEDEDLSKYKGGVYSDGIGKMAEVISSSPVVVDIISIGPMTNFPSLVQKFPGVVNKSRVVAMGGSIYRGYSNNLGQVAEYNVAVCPWCFSVLLDTGMNVTITPLDTSGTLRLDAKELQYLFGKGNQTSLALASSLVYFCLTVVVEEDKCNLHDAGSPILYDTVATLLSLTKTAQEYVEFEDMKLSVNATGYIVVDPTSGISVSVALSWKDEAGFTMYLTKVLVGL